MSYLEHCNVSVTNLIRFNSNSCTRSITAKVNVALDCVHIIGQSSTWPHGVRCRILVRNRDWYQHDCVQTTILIPVIFIKHTTMANNTFIQSLLLCLLLLSMYNLSLMSWNVKDIMSSTLYLSAYTI